MEGGTEYKIYYCVHYIAELEVPSLVNVDKGPVDGVSKKLTRFFVRLFYRRN